MTKTHKRKSPSVISNIRIYLRPFFIAVSFVGVLISLTLHLIFILTRIRFEEIEKVTYLVFFIMFVIVLRRFNSSYYFQSLPMHGKIALGLIMVYSFWFYISGFLGTLNKSSTDLRNISEYNSTMFVHSFVIAGYTFINYYWRYVFTKIREFHLKCA